MSSIGVLLSGLAALAVYLTEPERGWDVARAASVPGDRETEVLTAATRSSEMLVSRAQRLRREYLGTPSAPQYFRMLASSLSHLLREPVAALVHFVQDSAKCAEDDEDSRGREDVSGQTLMEADGILRSSILLGTWDMLSATYSEAGAPPPADAGHISAAEAEHLQWWVRWPGIRRVCEVGFNAGHSAAAILLADRNVSLLSIDIGEHGHVASAASLISSLFPSRFRLEIGESVSTFAKLGTQGIAQCDMTRIDGGHLGKSFATNGVLDTARRE